MESNEHQTQSPGLYVRPAPLPKKPSTAWKVIRLLGFLFVVGICLVSLFFNVIASSLISGAAPSGTQVNEVHVSGANVFSASAKVAIISVDGVLVGDEKSGPAEWIMSQLKKAREDAKVKAVLLDVNSPGGGITTADIIYNAVIELKSPPYNKKVVVLMGDVAASGAYYISAPADTIIARPTTITGSIGVLISSFNIEGLMEKVGVESVVFKSAPNKDILSIFRPVSEDEKAILQGITDEMFQRFKDIVAEGRGMTAQEVEAAATGSIFTSSQAKALKLIDEIGYYDDAVSAAKQVVAMRDIAVVRYERPPTLADYLFGAEREEASIARNLSALLESRQPGFYYLWPGP